MADSDITATLRAVDQNFASTFQAAQAAVQQFAQKSSAELQKAAAQVVNTTNDQISALNRLIQQFKTTQESIASIKERMESFSETVKHLAEAFLLIKGFEWAKEAVASGFELAEQLVRTSTITGISAQELERLKFAAEATGTSFESVTR